MVYSENILFCIAMPLLLTLLFVRGGAFRFALSFLLGMTTCLIAAYISGYLSYLTGSTYEETAVFLSPIVEEVLKLLPLLYYFLVFQPSGRAVFQSSIAIGAGFATFENCCYILSVNIEHVTFVAMRGMSVGIMHIVCMLGLAFGLLLARFYGAASLASVLGALSLSALFHASYNLLVSEPGLSTLVGYGLPLLTAAMLYLPYRAFARELLARRQRFGSEVEL